MDVHPEQELRMELKGLMLDPSSEIPIIILKDPVSQIFLPIWIGLPEAKAIAWRIEGMATPRPMTHDLLQSAIEALGGQLLKVVISDLQENTFFARLHLMQGEETITVDARPSDAVALAVRTDSPIFVLRAVLEKAQAVELATQASDEERLRKWLEEISPDELGKYTM